MSINLGLEEDHNGWLVKIREYVQLENENPAPGTEIYRREPILQPDGQPYKKERYSFEQINALFDQFGIQIVTGDNFTDQIRRIVALAGIHINQTRPPYTINPADLEIVDTETEVAPIPEV